MNITKLLNVTVASVLALVLSGNASAAINWTFPDAAGTGQLTDIDDNGPGDDTYVTTVSTVEATFSAWSNNLDGGGNTSSEYAIAHLWAYGGGLGISAEPWSGVDDSQPSQNHAVGGYECDSSNCTTGSYLEEFILVEYDQLMALTDIGLGWQSGDSDMTIMAYTGGYAGNQAHFLDGFQKDDMQNLNSDPLDSFGSTHGFTNAGWEIVANPNNVYANNGLNSDVTFNTGAGQVFSNYWLIGNRNSHLTGDNYGGNDFFKVNLIGGHKFVGTDGGDTGGVPVPGTALLLGLGLLMVRARARSQL